MSGFEPEKIKLKMIIESDDHHQNVRKKLLKFIDENPEMEEYINWLKNRRFNLGILLGFMLTLIGIELILIGYIIKLGMIL